MPDPTPIPNSVLGGPFITGSLDEDPTVSAAIAANPKSALATTEFFVVMFINLVATAIQFGVIKAGSQVAVMSAFIAQAATNALYIWSRTSLKKAHVDAVAKVASAAAAPASSSIAVSASTTPAAAPAVTP